MARQVAMFTDVSLCIGCRACQVACKQWNQLEPEEPEWTGSYQNHEHFTDQTFRLVRFIEEPATDTADMRWHMMSDVCKHCTHAACLEACPTGAIYRTDYGTVNINQDLCNGCRYCISACPFGVVSFNHATGTATKCTFCNDRLHNGLGPACAKACPTQSITFGYRDELEAKAKQRVEELQQQGVSDAQLYGADQNGPLGGLNAFFLRQRRDRLDLLDRRRRRHWARRGIRVQNSWWEDGWNRDSLRAPTGRFSSTSISSSVG